MNVDPATDTASRCEFYRRECDLAAVVQHEQQITVPVGGVAAITMPTRLGTRVREHLRRCGEPIGPVISHPRSDRWTFLVRPDLDDDMGVFSALFRLNVLITGLGGQIALPSPRDERRGPGAFRLWVQPPHSCYRPSGKAVVDAIRSCATAHADRREVQTRSPGDESNPSRSIHTQGGR